MIFKNNRPNQIPDINFHSKTFNNRTLTYKPTKNSSTTITQLFTITNPKTKLSNESRVHYTFNCIKKKLESNQCDHLTVAEFDRLLVTLPALTYQC